MYWNNRKTAKLLAIAMAYLSVYLVIKYALPLFAPFVIAYIFAWCIRPLANFFSNKCRLRSGTSAVCALCVTVGTIAAVIVWLFVCTAGRMGAVLKLWNQYAHDMAGDVERTCSSVERTVGMQEGTIYHRIMGYLDAFDINRLISRLMGNSVSAAITSVEYIVAVLIVLIAAFYFLKDKKELDAKRRQSFFGKEINQIMSGIYTTGVAYLKTQGILMILTSIVCFLGFSIAKIRHAFLYALLVGILDALPLVGAGVLLLPAAVLYFLRSQFKQGIILIIVFVICYCMREILEPRIMGKNVGLSPIKTMAAMYVGYRLFGILGVFAGPFAYIAANELVRIFGFGKGVEKDEEQIKNVKT